MLHDMPGFGKLSLQKMMLFHHVVRFGSIAKAARELGVAGHKIHNELNSLEKMLGTSLLLKNKKKIVLTEAGREFEAFVGPVVENFLSLSLAKGREENKTFIVHGNQGFIDFFAPEISLSFSLAHPHLKLQFCTHVSSDFETSHPDIVIGSKINNRTDLTQQIVGRFDYGLFASKEYIAKNGAPKTLKDCGSHKFLKFFGDSPKTGELYENVVLESSSYRALVQMTTLGMGICSLPIDLIPHYYSSTSNLVHIMPEYVVESYELYLIYEKFSSRIDLIQEFYKLCKASIIHLRQNTPSLVNSTSI